MQRHPKDNSAGKQNECALRIRFVFFNAGEASIHFPTVGCSEAEDRDNSVECQHLARIKNRGCYSSACVGVEGVSYQTALKEENDFRCPLIVQNNGSRPAFALYPSQQRGGGGSYTRLRMQTFFNIPPYVTITRI